MTFTLAGMVVGEDEKPSLLGMTKKLFSSIPFDAYIVMTILSILKLQLPAVMISFADTAGGANAFLALLMLGIGFEIHMDREKIAQIVQILVMRYGIAVLMAVGFYFFAPSAGSAPDSGNRVSGAGGSIAPAFTGALNGDVEMASAVNSLSIIISIAAITAALIILL